MIELAIKWLPALRSLTKTWYMDVLKDQYFTTKLRKDYHYKCRLSNHCWLWLSCPRAATVLSRAEEQAKELKEKQRQIKDNHSTGLGQIDMMNDLMRLLQIKLEYHRHGGSTEAGSLGPMDPMHEYSKPQEFTSGTANVLAL
jgi:hypothetical protein